MCFEKKNTNYNIKKGGMGVKKSSKSSQCSLWMVPIKEIRPVECEMNILKCFQDKYTPNQL